MPWFSKTQRAYLRQKAADLGLTFIDLTPALQNSGTATSGRTRAPYYPANVHYTPSGHRLVGDALAAANTQLQIQEPSPRGKAA